MLRNLILLIFVLGVQSSWGLDSLSYSGRLVKADGSPVPGPVDLKAELAYSSNTAVILCSQDITNVALTNGVFHIKLDFDCSPKTLTQVLAETPATHSATIRITDITNGKTYSFQALHSMPYSNVSEQLVQMGASDGQILTWSSGTWKPQAPAATASGSIGTAELADGSVTDSKVASGISRGKLTAGVGGYVLVNDSAGLVSETPYLSIAQGGTGATTVSGVFTSLGLGTAASSNLGLTAGNALAIDDVVICDPTEKLMLTAAPTIQWICQAENTPVDSTKLPLAGGTMTGNIVMGTNRISGLPTPIAADEAVSKDYVDNLSESKWVTNGTAINYATGNVGVGVSAPAEKLDVAGNLALTGGVRLRSGTNYVEIKAPTLSSDLSFILPSTAGSSGNVLSTDGSGNLSWTSVANTTSLGGDLTGTISAAEITAGAIVNADIANSTITYGKLNIADGEIPQVKVTGLEAALIGKEPTIAPAGAIGKYWSGDKTWQTLNSAAVPELTNLYFTQERVRATDLSGLVTTPAGVTATDTVLTAIGKLAGNQANYVLKTGSTMSGALDLGANKITSLADPTLATDAATKSYVDNRASQWTTSGLNIFYNSGNVGIGTSTPSSKLQVSGTDEDTQITIENTSSIADKFPGFKVVNYAGTGWGHPVLSFANIGGSSGSPLATGSDITLASIIGAGFDGVSFPQAARIEFVTEDVFSGTTSPANIRFSTTSHGQTSFSEKMRITADGKVGIGVTNPTNHLSVGGNFGSNYVISGVSTTAYGMTLRTSEAIASSAAAFWVLNTPDSGTTNNTLFRVENNGNIGIGTATPTAKLDVVGTVKVNGVSTLTWSGDGCSNAAVNVTFTHADSSVFEITSMYSHYGYQNTHGATRKALVSNGAGVIEANDIMNITSANAGSWVYTRNSATSMTITKTAGSYIGCGKYFIKVEGSENLVKN